MFRQLMMWTLVCATSPSVCIAKVITSDSIHCDTIEYSISPQILNEIVVKASPMVTKTDRKIVRPDPETLLTADNGIDLLRKLQLAHISVNPLTNSIEIAGDGDVILCINGVESASTQIAALRPQDIQRIEYHDHPGLRYAGAAVVIDYIVSRHDSGGNVSIDAFGALAKGRWASIDNISGQFNCGHSVWTAAVGYFGQRKDKWLRNYDETWHYPDHTLDRHEEGLPVTVGGSQLETFFNYNYQHPSGNLFNVRIGYDLTDVPDQEEGDRRTILQTSTKKEPILVVEHTEERSLRPEIGLYYLHRLSENRNLIIDGRTSYQNSRMRHEYSENGLGESSYVEGDKYSMKLLAMYENRHGSRQWKLGLSGSDIRINNKYYHSGTTAISIDQAETSLMGEYSDRLENWGITGSLKTVYRYLGQGSTTLNRIFVIPTLGISYCPHDRWNVRYTASLDYNMPSAAEISEIAQPIQSGMVRQGNPTLRPFRVINQSVNLSFEGSLAGIEAYIEYRNEHKPIMESVLFCDNQFVKTYFNQRSFQRLTADATVTIRPWLRHLSVMVEPRLTRYFSYGRDYRHHHNIFRLGLSVDFTYGNWLAYGNLLSGPANRMYGEEIIEEKDMNQIMVGYKSGSWSLHFGIFNAFMKNYWMETRNLSALAPYISRAHSSRSSSYFAVKFNLSLDFGHKNSISADIPHSDSDTDSGILTGIR